MIKSQKPRGGRRTGKPDKLCHLSLKSVNNSKSVSAMLGRRDRVRSTINLENRFLVSQLMFNLFKFKNRAVRMLGTASQWVGM